MLDVDLGNESHKFGTRVESLLDKIIRVVRRSENDPEVVAGALINAIGLVILNTKTNKDRSSEVRYYTDLLARMVAQNEALRATKQ